MLPTKQSMEAPSHHMSFEISGWRPEMRFHLEMHKNASRDDNPRKSGMSISRFIPGIQAPRCSSQKKSRDFSRDDHLEMGGQIHLEIIFVQSRDGVPRCNLRCYVPDHENSRSHLEIDKNKSPDDVSRSLTHNLGMTSRDQPFMYLGMNNK